MGGGRSEVGVPSTSLNYEVKSKEVGGGRWEVGVSSISLSDEVKRMEVRGWCVVILPSLASIYVYLCGRSS